MLMQFCRGRLARNVRSQTRAHGTRSCIQATARTSRRPPRARPEDCVSPRRSSAGRAGEPGSRFARGPSPPGHPATKAKELHEARVSPNRANPESLPIPSPCSPRPESCRMHEAGGFDFVRTFARIGNLADGAGSDWRHLLHQSAASCCGPAASPANRQRGGTLSTNPLPCKAAVGIPRPGVAEPPEASPSKHRCHRDIRSVA